MEEVSQSEKSLPGSVDEDKQTLDNKEAEGESTAAKEDAIGEESQPSAKSDSDSKQNESESDVIVIENKETDDAAEKEKQSEWEDPEDFVIEELYGDVSENASQDSIQKEQDEEVVAEAEENTQAEGSTSNVDHDETIFEEVDANVSAEKNVASDEADMLGQDDMTVPEKDASVEEIDDNTEKPSPMDVDNASPEDVEMISEEVEETTSDPKENDPSSETIVEEENTEPEKSDVVATTEAQPEAMETETPKSMDPVPDEDDMVEEVHEDEEVQEADEVQQSDEAHEADEIQEPGEVQKPDEAQELVEVQETDEVQEIEEVREAENVQEIEEEEAQVNESEVADSSDKPSDSPPKQDKEPSPEKEETSVEKTPEKVTKEKSPEKKQPEEAEKDTQAMDEDPPSKNGTEKTNASGTREDDADADVENVQEPEESDVCLIPDTETEMTEAEKKRAIQARENAEKESELVEDSSTEKEPSDGASEEAAQESLLEETPAEPTAEGSTPHKTIIFLAVSARKKCTQCEKLKICGFRYKDSDKNTTEYLCEKQCVDNLFAANPGKFFLRRKKFLIDEVPDDDDGDHKCLQCKKNKSNCKYFFKQDDEAFYICSEDCYKTLSSDEPEKFNLKRDSIRVRNIGHTTISSKGSSNAETRIVSRSAAEAEAAKLERTASFLRRCTECTSQLQLSNKNLVWQTMDFCDELCLGKYQRRVGSQCQTCHGEVPHQSLGKYCVRFGFEIRQFCCATCLNNYKKGLKTCSCCQKDISGSGEGFLAPVGDKEQFKDFCSQACMRRYDSMVNAKKKLRIDRCAVCNFEKPMRVEMTIDGNEQKFCSNPCFSAFKFVSNIVPDQCGMCSKYFERKSSECYTIYGEKQRPKAFCSRICFNVYIIVTRQITSCQWCKVKKYDFDMIMKVVDQRQVMMCSLNCLTLYGVSINAFSRTEIKCDNCNTYSTPQYHLTMSDASMRNFCTYQCVMQFQSQFARVPLTLDSEAVASTTHHLTPKQTSKNSNVSTPFPTGLPKRVKLNASQITNMVKLNTSQRKNLDSSPASAKDQQNQSNQPVMPVISNVASLATGENETLIGNTVVRRNATRGRGRGKKFVAETRPPRIPSPPPPTGPPITRTRSSTSSPILASTPSSSLNTKVQPQKGRTSTRSTGTTPSEVTQPTPPDIDRSVETKIITVPPFPPMVRNVQTSCHPLTESVSIDCKPETAEIGIQTEEDYSSKILIPVPVPIYVPQPMYMYSAPFPVPVPIPLPIPVPIFVPTTRNSANGILKEIKKIQDKMPADPFEAELLMMAEMVADDKNESDSDSEEETKPEPRILQIPYTAPQPATNNVVVNIEPQNNQSFSEDVLQMALKMASGEYEEPGVDLESAMTASTITHPPPGMIQAAPVAEDPSMQMGHHLMMETSQRGGRGRKRGAIASPITPRNNHSPIKRQRLSSDHTPPQQQQQQVMPMEKPDANMCLKFTFGVNAWKQWVMTKNADIEKSSIRRRLFKTELLQMTADELNYSLCLFVKEVRKPNGTEYAPDTIYYLVLGIQQYLYENGRIDNIFTDPYYERFTDCLDEVARKFSVLYNDSQYIVTRVEEEHLWECKQLGAHSPHVLLSTLMFFNTKHFNLTTVEEHMQLSFSHIMKHWKRSAQNAKSPGTRNVLLRFYPPQAGLDANPRKKKVYEQQENEERPLRCPVRLYEFYLSKCPESVKTRNDVFYLQPERSCVPDSPVWYSTQALSQESLQKMLHRVKMVKEINIALLTS